MKRYDSYKDSGVKWLGEIPSHWEVKRLRAALSERKERFNSAESLMILSLIKDKGIIPYDEKGEVGNKSKDDHTQYKVARKGDLVINSMNVIIGSLGITPYDGYISPAYYAFKPNNNIFLSYYNYILSLRKVQQSIRCFSKGIMEIRLKISAYDFLSMPFPFPTIKEQEAIANYLDSATSKIDEVIAQQQKMIDLLNERKQIIINNAVTKGLDPNVKMKPSGIDWIGDIPEHWEVSRFKSCSFVKANLVHPQNYLSYQQISPECIEKNSGRLIGNKTVADAGVISDNHYFKKGQILYSKIRPALNKAIIAPFDGLCSADMYPIETINHPNFMLYVILSHYFSGQVQLVVNDRVKMPKINKEELGEIVVTYPPKIVEQGMISSYIERELDKIQSVILKYNKQISLLQERKQIIINDVVTGKVKVV